MSAELIYRTTSPAAHEWWKHGRELLEQQRLLRQAFMDEQREQYGQYRSSSYREEWVDREMYVSSRGGVLGISSGWNEEPPADSGWRLDSKERYWKPALRAAAGRKLRDRLHALTIYVPRSHFPEIGIPEMVWGDHHIYWAGLEHDDDPWTLYQTWGSGSCEKACLAEQAKHPEIEWTEVPRSQWYARLEAKQQVDA